MLKVVVGMSGGVDSSVTAYLLKERGYDVEGISFILWEARKRSDFTACCSMDALAGASRTAEVLGISHSAIDARDDFIEKVIEPFVDAYTKGLTPNPCILCNRHIKFPLLLSEAQKRGADFIATGHYARTGKGNVPGVYFLRKGVDSKKDQSYVLYRLRPEEMERLVLPLGDYRKEEIREIARSLHLDAAERPESQEICFVGDGDYSAFIEQLTESPGHPGPIVNTTGQVVGTHSGIHRYTIGQRKGLGIASLQPHYVTKIDTVNNILHVGAWNDASAKEIIVRDLNWLMPPPDDSFRSTVKVRSMMPDRPATVELRGEEAKIVFDEPVWAPAPGQSAVMYSGEYVLGGGIISEF